jgi:aconitate hydratase
VYFLTPDVVGFELKAACARLHRHRPGADGDRDPAPAQGGGQVRRILRRRHASLACPTAPPSATWRPNTAPPWAFPVDERTIEYFEARAAPRPRSRCSRPTFARRACSARARASRLLAGHHAGPGRRHAQHAGPRRPQDRIELGHAAERFQALFSTPMEQGGFSCAPRRWTARAPDGGDQWTAAPPDEPAEAGAPRKWSR